MSRAKIMVGRVSSSWGWQNFFGGNLLNFTGVCMCKSKPMYMFQISNMVDGRNPAPVEINNL